LRWQSNTVRLAMAVGGVTRITRMSCMLAVDCGAGAVLMNSAVKVVITIAADPTVAAATTSDVVAVTTEVPPVVAAF